MHQTTSFPHPTTVFFLHSQNLHLHLPLSTLFFSQRPSPPFSPPTPFLPHKMVEKRKGMAFEDAFSNTPLSPVSQISNKKKAELKEDEESLLPSAPAPHNRSSTADDDPLLEKKKLETGTFTIFCMTIFNFAYGCVSTTMGLFILPAEAVRLFPEDESMALGCFLLVIGVSQLICPYTGLVSDRCTSRLGRRRPYILGGTALALMSVSVMHYASLHLFRWAFGVALFFAMTALNVIYSAQCSLVPDLVSESRQGAASGIVAVQQLMGSFCGFVIVMYSAGTDIHLAYFLYQVLLTGVIFVVCMAANETPLEGKVSQPTAKEIIKSYSIDTSKDMDFFWVFVSRTFFYAAVSCQAFMMFYIRDVVGTKTESQAREQMAAIAMIGQITAASVAFPVGRVSDTQGLSRKSMIYFACAVMTVVYVLFVVVPLIAPAESVIYYIYGVAAFYGVGNGCYLAVDYALALDVMPSKATSGQDLGVWGIAAFIGSSLGPMVWGFVLKAGGKSGQLDEYVEKGGHFCVLLSCLLIFFCGSVNASNKKKGGGGG